MAQERAESLPQHVAQTAESLGSLHARALATRSRHQRTIEWLTTRLGQPAAIYAIATGVASWVGLNVAMLLSGARPVDPPPFYYLQSFVGIAALLMTTMVLTTQMRQTRHADDRARLDLEVNLLSEAKVAKLIALLEELRRDLPNVPNRRDTLAEEMQVTADPHRMLSALEETIDSDGESSKAG